jgi:hypothetical protein
MNNFFVFHSGKSSEFLVIDFIPLVVPVSAGQGTQNPPDNKQERAFQEK